MNQITDVKHLNRIASLAVQVRTAQKRYFRQRDNLQECKLLEGQLDDELKLLSDGSRQGVLFDNSPDAARE